MARRRSGVRRAGAGRKITPGVLLAGALFVGAVGLVVVKAGRTGAGQSVMQVGDDGAAVAGQAATGPARASGGFFGRLGEMWNQTAHIQDLERENRDLRTWRQLAEDLAERNKRYEELLHMSPDAFGQGADIQNSIAAQLVLDSGGPFTRTLVANAGAVHGVKVGYIAVNENGLVGRVVSVGQHTSRVLMLDDYNSRIPVLGEASRVRAVLAGQAARPPELYTDPFQMQAPRLDFIVGAQSLRDGERIITSGDGGLYPRGITVGVARHDRDGGWHVALAASQRPIDFVRLIPYVGVEAPESSASGNQTPPLAASSSVAVIFHDTTPPPPGAVVVAPPAPRPRPATTTPAAVTAPAQTPAAPAQQPASPPAHTETHTDAPAEHGGAPQ
ncbi:MAG: rod shape-determining protein MreC [Terricaulis sp.]